MCLVLIILMNEWEFVCFWPCAFVRSLWQYERSFWPIEHIFFLEQEQEYYTIILSLSSIWKLIEAGRKYVTVHIFWMHLWKTKQRQFCQISRNCQLYTKFNCRFYTNLAINSKSFVPPYIGIILSYPIVGVAL